MKRVELSTEEAALLHEITAQHEPSPEKYGESLIYDSTPYHRTFAVIDPVSKELTRLGPIEEAVVRLQFDYGLTPSQAREAVGRAFSSLNAPIPLQPIRMMASEESITDSRLTRVAMDLAAELGHSKVLGDEEICGVLASIAQRAQRIVEMTETGVDEFRRAASTYRGNDRRELSTLLTGLDALLAGVQSCTSEIFDDE